MTPEADQARRAVRAQGHTCYQCIHCYSRTFQGAHGEQDEWRCSEHWACCEPSAPACQDFHGPITSIRGPQ